MTDRIVKPPFYAFEGGLAMGGGAMAGWADGAFQGLAILAAAADHAAPVHQIGGQRGQIHGTATGVVTGVGDGFAELRMLLPLGIEFGIAQPLQEGFLGFEMGARVLGEGAENVGHGLASGGLPDAIAQLVDEFGQPPVLVVELGDTDAEAIIPENFVHGGQEG